VGRRHHVSTWGGRSQVDAVGVAAGREIVHVEENAITAELVVTHPRKSFWGEHPRLRAGSEVRVDGFEAGGQGHVDRHVAMVPVGLDRDSHRHELARAELIVWAFLIRALASAKEGFASGNATIQVSRDEVEVLLATFRKIPMPGHEKEYGRKLIAWRKANQVVADRAVAAIESDVLPRYRKTLPLLANSFNAEHINNLSTEGVAREGYDDAVWLLTVDLDLYPDNSADSRARFVFKTRPSKANVRAFSRDVQAAVLRTVGRKLPASPSYTAYWLVADDMSTSLLLSTVPLAELKTTLEQRRGGCRASSCFGVRLRCWSPPTPRSTSPATMPGLCSRP